MDGPTSGGPTWALTDVLALAEQVSNWGRWGPDDQLGTLNLITPEVRRRGLGDVRSGETVTLSLPLGGGGPQTGQLGRFNPVHVMLRDGGDAVTGATVEHVFGGIDRQLRGTDDLLLLPTQASTHWDGLAHVIHQDLMYNNAPATQVSSFGAATNGIEHAAAGIVGPAVLLDAPRALGVEALEVAQPITAAMLDELCHAHRVEIRSGDILLVRTGHLARCRSDGWGGYAGGPAPGFSLDAVAWFADRQVAAVASDTWGFEVIPNQLTEVFQPVHLVAVVYMGLWIGEMFDLERLADRVAQRADSRLFLAAQPMPILGGVASPASPVALL